MNRLRFRILFSLLAHSGSFQSPTTAYFFLFPEAFLRCADASSDSESDVPSLLSIEAVRSIDSSVLPSFFTILTSYEEGCGGFGVKTCIIASNNKLSNPPNFNASLVIDAVIHARFKCTVLHSPQPPNISSSSATVVFNSPIMRFTLRPTLTSGSDEGGSTLAAIGALKCEDANIFVYVPNPAEDGENFMHPSELEFIQFRIPS